MIKKEFGTTNAKQVITYRRVLPTTALYNNNKDVSFLSMKFTELKAVYVRGYGRLMLAPREGIILLPKETIDLVKRKKISIKHIINICNDMEKDIKTATIKPKITNNKNLNRHITHLDHQSTGAINTLIATKEAIKQLEHISQRKSLQPRAEAIKKFVKLRTGFSENNPTFTNTQAQPAMSSNLKLKSF